MYIADGYGNARVHRFSAAGALITSWGASCSNPGEFKLPRENSRIQIFDADGVFLNVWNWVNRRDDLFIDEDENLYIAELGWSTPSRMFPHYRFMDHPPVGHDPVARVTVCDLDGRVISRFGGADPVLPGNFIAPHGIWADSSGDLYVGEVVKRSGAVDYFAPLPCQAFQKFRRSW